MARIDSLVSACAIETTLESSFSIIEDLGFKAIVLGQDRIPLRSYKDDIANYEQQSWNERQKRLLIDPYVRGVGVYLPDDVIVLDVDHKNGSAKGLTSLERLLAEMDFQEAFQLASLIIRTKTNGYHFWLRKSGNDFIPRHVIEYEGIDIKKGGDVVPFAGTVSGSGRFSLLERPPHITNEEEDEIHISQIQDKLLDLIVNCNTEVREYGICDSSLSRLDIACRRIVMMEVANFDKGKDFSIFGIFKDWGIDVDDPYVTECLNEYKKRNDGIDWMDGSVEYKMKCMYDRNQDRFGWKRSKLQSICYENSKIKRISKEMLNDIMKLLTCVMSKSTLAFDVRSKRVYHKRFLHHSWMTEVSDFGAIKEGAASPYTEIDSWCNLTFKLMLDTTDTASHVMNMIGVHNPVDRVKELFDTVIPPWDGVERLDNFMAKCCGIGREDHRYELVRAYSRKFMCGILARVYSNEPVKFDYMIVLLGDQGIRKSTFCKVLALENEELFAEKNPDKIDKNFCIDIEGKIICEIPEMSAFLDPKQVDAVKSFLSTGIDNYRGMYQTNSKNVVRLTMFLGSRNSGDFLIDPTGSRRFWVIKPKEGRKIDIDYARSVIHQVYAEAKTVYKNEDLFLTDELENKRIRVANRIRKRKRWEEKIEDLYATFTVAVSKDTGEAPVEVLFETALKYVSEEYNKVSVVDPRQFAQKRDIEISQYMISVMGVRCDAKGVLI